MRTRSWRDLAACRGVHPDVFYPTAEDEAAVARAKEICDGCMVRETCLDHALVNREREGVWGGASEADRRRMLRQRRRSA